MSYLNEPLEAVLNIDLDSLPRVEALGDLNFNEAVPKLRLVLDTCRALNLIDAGALPSAVVRDSLGLLTEFPALVDRMNALTLVDPSSATERAAIMGRIEEIREWFAVHARPQISTQGVDIVALAARAAETLAKAEQAELRSTELIERLSKLAGATAAGRLSSHYEAQVTVHKQRANWALRVAVAAGVVTAAVAFFLFVTLRVDKAADGNTQWAELVRALLVRLFFLGLLGAVIAIALRSYRANSHQQMICEQKRNALDTFGLFSESLVDQTTRDLVTAELVRNVFSSASTGYEEHGTESAVVDTGPLLSMLLRTK